MNYHAEIEFYAGAIRVFREGLRRPDPYEYGASLRWINPQQCELCVVREGPGAVSGRMTDESMPQVRAMAKALYAVGITTAFWKRYHAGREHHAVVDCRRIALDVRPRSARLLLPTTGIHLEPIE